MEKNILMELKQQLTKENMIGDINLTHVREDFYPDVYQYIKDTSNNEAKVMFAKFKRHRLNKICRLACVGDDSAFDLLTPEEMCLYISLVESVEKYWK